MIVNGDEAVQFFVIRAFSEDDKTAKAVTGDDSRGMRNGHGYHGFSLQFVPAGFVDNFIAKKGTNPLKIK
jgi:hypothetical protein